MKIVIGILVFGLCVAFSIGGIKAYDRYLEAWNLENISRIQPGMTDAEVIDILGKPTIRKMSDIPGEYWCFGSDTFAFQESYRGSVMIEMSRDKRVVEVVDP